MESDIPEDRNKTLNLSIREVLTKTNPKRYKGGFGMLPTQEPWEQHLMVDGELPMIRPINSHEDILKVFFEIRPGCPNDAEAVRQVAGKLDKPFHHVENIIRTGIIRQEAKEQRAKYADKIYEEKIPVIKTIISKGLESVLEFVTNNKPKDYTEAKLLSSIATDLTKLLRLELGQSTHKVELIHSTQKDITVILDELQTTDPFVDYKQSSEDTELTQDDINGMRDI